MPLLKRRNREDIIKVYIEGKLLHRKNKLFDIEGHDWRDPDENRVLELATGILKNLISATVVKIRNQLWNKDVEENSISNRWENLQTSQFELGRCNPSTEVQSPQPQQK